MTNKTISIHQPQYIPWLPYFLKAEESNIFIILDSVDFQKNGLQNRNQINTVNGPLWLTVPVKQKSKQKIIDVQINNNLNWKKKHWSTLLQNYRKANAFSHYMDEMEKIFSQEWNYLNELNISIMEKMFNWLGIDIPTLRSSEMNAEGNGSELILNLCLETGATKYISGIGGHNYLDEVAFKEAGIEIIYRAPELLGSYLQQFPKLDFVNNLSALDIIFNCGDKWRNHIKIKTLTR